MSMSRRNDKEHMAAIGRKGGLATVARHGREHMRRIGKRGFDHMVEKYWAGNRRRAVERLAELGRMSLDPAPWNGAWQKPRQDGEPW